MTRIHYFAVYTILSFFILSSLAIASSNPFTMQYANYEDGATKETAEVKTAESSNETEETPTKEPTEPEIPIETPSKDYSSYISTDHQVYNAGEPSLITLNYHVLLPAGEGVESARINYLTVTNPVGKVYGGGVPCSPDDICTLGEVGPNEYYYISIPPPAIVCSTNAPIDPREYSDAYTECHITFQPKEGFLTFRETSIPGTYTIKAEADVAISSNSSSSYSHTTTSTTSSATPLSDNSEPPSTTPTPSPSPSPPPSSSPSPAPSHGRGITISSEGTFFVNSHVCVSRIEFKFDKSDENGISNYFVGDPFEVSVRAYDSEGNIIPNKALWISASINGESMGSGAIYTDNHGDFSITGRWDVPLDSGFEFPINIDYKVYTNDENCEMVEDTEHVVISMPVINWEIGTDKDVYDIGEKIVASVTYQYDGGSDFDLTPALEIKGNFNYTDGQLGTSIRSYDYCTASEGNQLLCKKTYLIELAGLQFTGDYILQASSILGTIEKEFKVFSADIAEKMIERDINYAKFIASTKTYEEDPEGNNAPFYWSGYSSGEFNHFALLVDLGSKRMVHDLINDVLKDSSDISLKEVNGKTVYRIINYNSIVYFWSSGNFLIGIVSERVQEAPTNVPGEEIDARVEEYERTGEQKIQDVEEIAYTPNFVSVFNHASEQTPEHGTPSPAPAPEPIPTPAPEPTPVLEEDQNHVQIAEAYMEKHPSDIGVVDPKTRKISVSAYEVQAGGNKVRVWTTVVSKVPFEYVIDFGDCSYERGEIIPEMGKPNNIVSAWHRYEKVGNYTPRITIYPAVDKNYDNNEVYSNKPVVVKITGKRPDLTITGMELQPNKRGKILDVVVKNQGTADSASFKTVLYIDGKYYKAAPAIYKKPLGVGQEMVIKFFIPVDKLGEEYKVIVDSPKLISELDEGNNVLGLSNGEIIYYSRASCASSSTGSSSGSSPSPAPATEHITKPVNP